MRAYRAALGDRLDFRDVAPGFGRRMAPQPFRDALFGNGNQILGDAGNLAATTSGKMESTAFMRTVTGM